MDPLAVVPRTSLGRVLQKVKKRIRNGVAVILLFTGIPYMMARRVQRTRPLVRVVLFHHIKDPHAFARLLDSMRRSYAIISPRDFEIGRLHAKKVNVLLTFDDGYETWVTDVLPQLQQRNLSAIFFVNSGFVDTHGDRRAEHAFSRDNIYSWADTPLSWEQVRKAAAAGIAIGGHGRLHRAASVLTDAELSDEISEDREIIATKIASAPMHFAYPFGILTQAARYHVRAAGYEYAFATHSGFVRAFDLPYSIPRSNTGVCSPLVMRAWVWGAHDLLHALVQKIKHPRGRPSSI